RRNQRLEIKDAEALPLASVPISKKEKQSLKFPSQDEQAHLEKIIEKIIEKPDDPERTDSYVKSGTERNNESESSSASSEQIIPATISKKKISLDGSGNPIDIDKLLSSVLTCSILLFLLIVIIWLVVVKKLWNLESIMPKEKVGYPAHKKYINREEVPDRPGITPKYLPYEYWH
ncbi:21410_t:CDS:2, partial [Gigaspora rosea]